MSFLLAPVVQRTSPARSMKPILWRLFQKLPQWRNVASFAQMKKTVLTSLISDQLAFPLLTSVFCYLAVKTKDGLSVIQAPAGEDGVYGSFDGADGFSGGGGDGEFLFGSGGSDGRDGEAGSGGQGGKGSGLDISSYDLINFVLTPGSGGRHRCGGGGGGVLVNGEGPEHYSGSGEGYGGGGEGCNYSSRYGSPGAILIEIKK